MEIRKSTLADIGRIMEIFASARDYMISQGNNSQWINGYPGEALLTADIRDGNSYVIEQDGSIVGTFSFIPGVEPTYQHIENGHWSCDRPYGTIHRLASSGKARGISRACFEYCLGQLDYLRIDTHRDNRSMQRAIEAFGFCRCGTIYVRDGSPRIAYDYLKKHTN